jgi:hypothetical protein
MKSQMKTSRSQRSNELDLTGCLQLGPESWGNRSFSVGPAKILGVVLRVV